VRCLPTALDGEPLRLAGEFDPIAVPPPMLVVLDVVIKDERVHFLDLVKEASPGNVGGL